MTVARLKPADFRRNAFRLMKDCWKLLLVAAVLMSLFNWAGRAAQSYGKGKALAAYNDYITTFYTENPRPEDEEEYITWAYFEEDWALYEAERLYNRTYLSWQLAGVAADVLDAMLSGVVLVSLYTGLMMHRRSGECTLHCLTLGFSRWKRACRLALRVLLGVMGWSLLAMIPAYMVSFVMDAVSLYDLGDWLALVIIAGVVLWAQIYYGLVYLHMAEDAADCFAVRDYLSDGVQQMSFFTIRGLLRCSWPVWALMAAEILLGVAAEYGLLPALPVDMLCEGSRIFRTMLLCAVYVCVYEELRSRNSADDVESSYIPMQKENEP